MAAPLVTGTIALVWSAHPTWSMQQVIDAVLDHTTPDSNLTGEVTTGGVVNAAGAVANTDGPHVVASTTVGAVGSAGGFNGVQVTFNEEVNPSTFSAAQVTLTGPNGAISGLSVSVVSGSNDHQFLISFPGQTTPGTYNLTVGPAIQDWYGNEMNQNRNGVNGESSDAFTSAIQETSATATFLHSDTTTQGTWIGTYGVQGYDIVSGPVSLPSGDTVTPAGQSTYTWTTTSTDPRALQVPGSSNRVAAVWYGSTSFTVAVNLGDGVAHDLELYFDDWDNKGRAETVQLSDAATGDVLDTETISAFTSGVYLDWKASGNLVITITRTAGANAVLNGLFLDGTSRPASATFLQNDTTTQGSWMGTYGAQGYDIVSGPVSLPSGDTVTPTGPSNYTWTTTSSDPRALQVPGSSNRVAAVWYSSPSFTVAVNLGDGVAHDLELYFDDWDNKGRAETVQLSDAATGKVLDTETISAFTSGVYLDWKVSGNLVITITRTAGPNAVLNGLFLDGTTRPAASATFLQKDTTTQGTWIGTYGAQGYDIVSGPVSLPSGDTVTPGGQSTYTWTTTSSDPRALQVPGSSNRVAAVWYSSTSFTVAVNLGDGVAHNLELYFDDWDNKGRAETAQLSDAGTGTVLDTETISAFTSGVYLNWKVSGNLLITITRTAGANAVLNGLFFG
jgi:hypothetical protein